MSLIKIYNNTSQKDFKQQIENYVNSGYEEVHLYDKVKINPSLTYSQQVIHCTNPTEIEIPNNDISERVYLIRYTTDIPDKIKKEFWKYITSYSPKGDKYLSDKNIINVDYEYLEQHKIKHGLTTIAEEIDIIENYYSECCETILRYLNKKIDVEKMCETILNYPDINVIYIIYNIFRNLFIVTNGNLEQCYDPVSRTGLPKYQIDRYKEILNKNKQFSKASKINMETLATCLNLYKEGKLTEITLKNIAIVMLLLGENDGKKTNN